MSNEARIQSSLTIKKVNANGVTQIDYASRNAGFVADVIGTKGPTPGSVTISITGTDIIFGELTTPGLCRLMNQDATNYVEVGIRDPLYGFYPLIELLPGESYIIRLSRNMMEQYTGTGTGTTGDINYLHAIANTSPVNLLIDCFEK